MKEFWKSINIWQRYGQEFGVLFFLTHGVYVPFTNFYGQRCKSKTYFDLFNPLRKPSAWLYIQTIDKKSSHIFLRISRFLVRISKSYCSLVLSSVILRVRKLSQFVGRVSAALSFAHLRVVSRRGQAYTASTVNESNQPRTTTNKVRRVSTTGRRATKRKTVGMWYFTCSLRFHSVSAETAKSRFIFNLTN